MSPVADPVTASTDRPNFETASSTALPDTYAVLDTPAFKDEALGLWLLAYVGLLDTICADTPPAVRCREADETEVVFISLGGRITMSLRVETDAFGITTDFGVMTLSAIPRLPGLAHLRFDLDETDNPLIALTHSLLRIVDLKRVPILAALNGAATSPT